MSTLYLNFAGLTISYYSLSILTGIILGYVLVSVRAKKYGVSTDHIDNLLLFTLPVSILGARLYHVFAEWGYYKDNLDKVLSLQMSGLGIFGALIGGLLVFTIYAKIKKLNIWKLLDLGSLGLLVGQIAGRFGNFFNKELYGNPTNLPWKVYIPLENRVVGYEGYEYFHPTFFYESIWNLIGLMILLKVETQNAASLQKGRIFALYLIWYGIGRLIIGFIRIEPNDLWIFNDGQILSIILIIVGFTILLIKSRNSIDGKTNQKD